MIRLADGSRGLWRCRDQQLGRRPVQPFGSLPLPLTKRHSRKVGSVAWPGVIVASDQIRIKYRVRWHRLSDNAYMLRQSRPVFGLIPWNVSPESAPRTDLCHKRKQYRYLRRTQGYNVFRTFPPKRSANENNDSGCTRWVGVLITMATQGLGPSWYPPVDRRFLNWVWLSSYSSIEVLTRPRSYGWALRNMPKWENLLPLRPYYCWPSAPGLARVCCLTQSPHPRPV